MGNASRFEIAGLEHLIWDGGQIYKINEACADMYFNIWLSINKRGWKQLSDNKHINISRDSLPICKSPIAMQ